MLEMKVRKNCVKCTAILENGDCDLGYNNGEGENVSRKPHEPCPKPTNKKLLHELLLNGIPD